VARFTPTSLPPPAPAPGVHVARIVRAKEKVSEAGNAMLVMTVRFADLSELGFIITFVERAARLVTYFCRSCELVMPEGELEIRPADVEGRIFYPVVELDGEGLEAVPKITRFLDRQTALAANPRLADIKLGPQQPLALPIVRKPSL
jgi:hypothetical protein